MRDNEFVLFTGTVPTQEQHQYACHWHWMLKLLHDALKENLEKEVNESIKYFGCALYGRSL